MTEPLDDARGELLALADYLDAGHNYLSDPEMIAKYKRWSATLRAPVTQPVTWPSVNKYVAGYEYRGDQDYAPNDGERAMIEDAIHGYLITCTPTTPPSRLDAVNAPVPSNFSPGDPVEVRLQEEAIDEIVIRRGDVHIEQMSADSWFMGVDASDGSYWQFWFGAKNRKSHVEFRHTETVPAAENAALSTDPGTVLNQGASSGPVSPSGHPAPESDALLHLAREALMSAEAQIEYLHEKFKPTGSGNNALAKIDIALTAINRFFEASAVENNRTGEASAPLDIVNIKSSDPGTVAVASGEPLPPDWKQDQAETSRLPRKLCSCKASQRDGQHMAWCPAISSTMRDTP